MTFPSDMTQVSPLGSNTVRLTLPSTMTSVSLRKQYSLVNISQCHQSGLSQRKKYSFFWHYPVSRPQSLWGSNTVWLTLPCDMTLVSPRGSNIVWLHDTSQTGSMGERAEQGVMSRISPSCPHHWTTPTSHHLLLLREAIKKASFFRTLSKRGGGGTVGQFDWLSPNLAWFFFRYSNCSDFFTNVA